MITKLKNTVPKERQEELKKQFLLVPHLIDALITMLKKDREDCIMNIKRASQVENLQNAVANNVGKLEQIDSFIEVLQSTQIKEK